MAEAFGKRPDIQNLGAGLPLGEVVLSADDMDTLVDTLRVPSAATRMKAKLRRRQFASFRAIIARTPNELTTCIMM